MYEHIVAQKCPYANYIANAIKSMDSFSAVLYQSKIMSKAGETLFIGCIPGSLLMPEGLGKPWV